MDGSMVLRGVSKLNCSRRLQLTAQSKNMWYEVPGH
jgi:hypothetical protein